MINIVLMIFDMDHYQFHSSYKVYMRKSSICSPVDIEYDIILPSIFQLNHISVCCSHTQNQFSTANECLAIGIYIFLLILQFTVVDSGSLVYIKWIMYTAPHMPKVQKTSTKFFHDLFLTPFIPLAIVCKTNDNASGSMQYLCLPWLHLILAG